MKTWHYVGRHALPLLDHDRFHVVAERLPELRVVEGLPLHADEDGLLPQRHACR